MKPFDDKLPSIDIVDDYMLQTYKLTNTSSKYGNADFMNSTAPAIVSTSITNKLAGDGGGSIIVPARVKDGSTYDLSTATKEELIERVKELGMDFPYYTILIPNIYLIWRLMIYLFYRIQTQK